MKMNNELVQDHPTLEVVVSLENMGYPVDVLETRVVESESKDKAYYVQKIDTLSKPIEQADVVADSLETWVCSCKAYLYQNSPITDSGPETLGDSTMCKHIKSEVRSEQAKSDDNQVSLV